jgi:transposase
MSQDQTYRTYSTTFKLDVIARLEAGASKALLAEELGIRRKLLYQWHDSWKAAGEAGLNRKRGPKAGSGRKRVAGSLPGGAASDMTEAKARIAELERIIGRQQADLDFFRQALRVLGETSPQGSAPAVSTRSSKP